MADIEISGVKLVEWRAKMEYHEAERERFAKLIDAYELLSTECSAGEESADLERAGDGVRSRPEVILSMLERLNKPLTPRALRKELAKTTGGEETWGKGFRYFYQGLGRLVERGKITKNGGRYSVAS